MASHDEDTTTMAVEAMRNLLRVASPAVGSIGSLWFATSTPSYLDKTNAAAIHAALGLNRSCNAVDFGGSLRSGTGALLAALRSVGSPGGDSSEPSLIALAMADLRDGLPTSPDESSGGDSAAGFLIGDDSPALPVLAEFIGSASLTEEFLDRWRLAGERRSRVWEERFGETRYLELGKQAWESGLDALSLSAGQVSKVAVTGMHARACNGLARKLGVEPESIADDLSSSVGLSGTSHPGLLLASMLEVASPGDVVALVHLADGADVLFFRMTDACGSWSPARSVKSQAESGSPLSYGKFLSWRNMVNLEPPRRPEPARASSSAAWRSNDWKYGFTGSQDIATGTVHLPPARVSMVGGAFDQMEPVERSDSQGSIATFTIDRMAYSPSPPTIFAVVDFDGGGRFPVELTDCSPDQVAIGSRVEMTFRRLYSADGIHNYFWKGRLVTA
ncbi:MAG TPA: OB-fold domain-containing protein [Acidimicrobiales bacterium]|nr:OB-fold domain-containing protein [Acidimicrobiales bacterium]